MESSVSGYIQIARIDHWFKNIFMVLGIVVAWFYEPDMAFAAQLPRLLLAVLATCLVASSNYVINEVLDAKTDRAHPSKKDRPVAAGRVKPAIAMAEWLLLAVVGLTIAFWINSPFGITACVFWVMGMVYNVPPLRTKEVPYLDVISEAVNNPLRLLLGWFVLIDNHLPPISLLFAYWFLGCFFMATKRLAELRDIGDPKVAAEYRRSFRHYTEDRLLVSIFFYISTCALFGGVFIIRCRVELFLFVPFAAGFFAQYMMLGLKPQSPVQAPERLYKEKGFLAYALICLFVFAALMFIRIPALHDLFALDQAKTPPLWVVK